MKLTTKFCLSKLRRLRGQDFFVSDEIVLGYLAHRLAEVAESPAHLDRMLDTWVNRTRAMLHPSDVEALARETAERSVLPSTCEVCVSGDYVIVEIEGATYAKRCECQRGRILAARDAANNDRKQRTAGMVV